MVDEDKELPELKALYAELWSNARTMIKDMKRSIILESDCLGGKGFMIKQIGKSGKIEVESLSAYLHKLKDTYTPMRMTLVLEHELEMELRRRALYKGDMSKIINSALKEYFAKNEDV